MPQCAYEHRTDEYRENERRAEPSVVAASAEYQQCDERQDQLPCRARQGE
jgi:hypothetical protein